MLAKKISKQLFVFLLLLIFFGVFIDTIHTLIHYGQWEFGLIEDGGEMFVMSIIVAYVYGIKTK